jgi:Emfourin
MSASRPSSPCCHLSLRIELTRSGGYAGLTTKLGELDTAELPEADARRVRDVVERAEAAARSQGATPGADRFQYHLTVEDEDGRRELTLGEDHLPEELRKLVR